MQIRRDDGGPPRTRPEPVHVATIPHAEAMTTDHECVVTPDALWCSSPWPPRSSYVYGTLAPVDGYAGMRDVVHGVGHECRLHADGRVRCQGANDGGQLGQVGAGAIERGDVPVEVEGLSGVVGLAAAKRRSCALDRGGVATCWGNFSPPPREQIISELPVTALFAGEGSLCAELEGGAPRCWGPGFQLHYPDTSLDEQTLVRLEPRSPRDMAWFETHPVCELEPLRCALFGEQVHDLPTDRARAIASTTWRTCAAHGHGAVTCWDIEPASEDATGLVAVRARTRDDLGEVVELPAAAGYMCARTAGAGPNVRCWGGDGERIELPVTAVDIAGQRSLCALDEAGAITCFTRGPKHGSSALDPSSLPAGLPPARALVDGLTHQCALLRDGGFACWDPEGVRVELEPPAGLGPTTLALRSESTASRAALVRAAR